MVIDVCCEFVCMPYMGKKFKDWEETLLFYCTCIFLIFVIFFFLAKIHQSDKYESSLRDGFVVGEMSQYESVNHFYFSTTSYNIKFQGDADYVDFLSSFRALATFVLINFGLVEVQFYLILTLYRDLEFNTANFISS